VDLGGAHLNRTDLSGADPSHANLTDADLTAADLSGADTTALTVEFDPAYLLPIGANLEPRLETEDLAAAKFDGGDCPRFG
jgi:uncharacterized protein YjbI with pentapeptide repeats